MRLPRLSRRLRGTLLAVPALALLAGASAWAGMRPSHDRAWEPGQAVLPRVTFQDSLVHVRNVRDFAYRTADDFTPRYEDRTYDLRRIERVWYVVSPFGSSWRGPAHTFLSFGFSDGRHVAVSVEARREVGEEYSVWKGALRRYELMYVIGDERDLIGLRARVWKDPVHLYPMRATPGQARALFVEMLRRAEEVAREPEFYNTFTNNCTTSIVDAVNTFAERRVGFRPEVLVPGYSDRLAHRLGWIDSGLPLEEAREAFLVGERALRADDSPGFSRAIRAR